MSVKTLQRWDRAGRLKPAARTPGNRRLYTPEQLNQVLDRVSKNKQVMIATLRVSSQAQKADPSNQTAELKQFWIARGIAVDEWICGLNFKRPKFSDLVDRIVRSELSTLMIARFGYELWSHLCERHGCYQIVVAQSRAGDRALFFIPVI